MSLTVSMSFTKNVGAPATGLTLSDICLYLTRENKETHAVEAVWNGTQHPTVELENIGTYLSIYAEGDLGAYNYYAGANYVGTQELDAPWAMGSAGENGDVIADAVFQRDMADVETDAPKHSLASAVLKSVSRVEGDQGDGTLTTYRTNGTTVHMTQDVTNLAEMEPISGLGVAE